METRVKRLELIADNLDERLQDHDERIIKQETKFRQTWPVLVMAAKRNLLVLITLAIAIASIIMQLTK
jgi:hypothetical protein